jgi:GTPase SAR1 family protein
MASQAARLTKAGASFPKAVASARHYNPLWRYIYEPFLQHIHAEDAATEQGDELYVEDRDDPEAGVEEQDILSYIRKDQQRPFLLIGHAGVGKTTFLKRALRRCDPAKHAVVWIDILSHYGDESDTLSLQHVEKAIGGALEDFVTEGRTSFIAWWRYLVTTYKDAQGLSSVLLDGLHETGRIDRKGLRDLLRGIHVMDVIRLKLSFLRKELGRIPVVVIDNGDQLSVQFQYHLRKMCIALARGSEGDRSIDHAVLIVALRPESIADVVPQKAVARASQGHLGPPRLSKVLGKRLDRFFAQFDGRVLRNTKFDVPRRGAVDFKELFPGDARSPDELGRLMVLELTRALTSETNLIRLLHRLANYNTRVALLVAAQFVASGHHDIQNIVETVQKTAGPVTWNKLFRTLILGTSQIYSTRDAWLTNLLNDSFGADADSVLTLPRVLKMLQQRRQSGKEPRERSLSVTRITDLMLKLFGCRGARTIAALGRLSDRGLILKADQDKYLLSDGGEAHLELMGSFEYLRHIVVDSYAPPELVVPCDSPNEKSSVRFARVLKFGEWVRRLEVEGLVSALGHADGLRSFTESLGETTFCEPIATALHTAERAVLKDEHEQLRRRAHDFRKRSTFGALLAEAQGRVATAPQPLTPPAPPRAEVPSGSAPDPAR